MNYELGNINTFDKAPENIEAGQEIAEDLIEMPRILNSMHESTRQKLGDEQKEEYLEQNTELEEKSRFTKYFTNDRVRDKLIAAFSDKPLSKDQIRRLTNTTRNLAKEYIEVAKTGKYGNEIFEAAYEERLENDNPDDGISFEEFNSKINETICAHRTNLGDREKSLAMAVASDLANSFSPEISEELRNTYDNFDENALKEARKKATVSTINKGEFLPGIINDSPEIATIVLEDIGVDKEQTFWAGMNGYRHLADDRTKETYNKVFDLQSQLINEAKKPENRFTFSLKDQKLFRYSDGFVNSEIPKELAQSAIEEITKSINSQIDKTYESEQVQEQIGKDKKDFEKSRKRELTAEMNEWPRNGYGYNYYGVEFRTYSDVGAGFDFDNYLNGEIEKTSKIVDLEDFVDQKNSLEYGHLLSREEFERELIERIGGATEIDYKDTIVDNLKWRLSQGTRPDMKNYSDYSHDDYFLTSIFKGESYEKHEKEIGIDFSDPEIFDLSMPGFINTIKARNGEESEQTDWYFENIFSHDIEKFVSEMNAYKEQETCGTGTKAKINRFLKNNEQIFEYLEQKEVERQKNRPEQEYASVMFDVDPKDLMMILSRRRQVIHKMKEYNPEEIDTLPNTDPFKADHIEGEENDKSGVSSVTGENLDYGVEKGNALIKYLNFVKQNIPNSNPHCFIDAFLNRQKDGTEHTLEDIKVDDTRSYMGFTFEYEGRQCLISESLGDPAAMYLSRDEIGTDYKKMFSRSKLYAREANENTVVINHHDKSHFMDSLDDCYKRAFLYFRTGDPKATADFSAEFPAWPLSVNNDTNDYREDIDRYREWQQRQMREFDELN